MLGEGNPFARHPLRRYAFGWEQLAARSGRHLDLSMLDVLEHVPDERNILAEVHRILAPDGLLVLTVPGHHAFSFMDPDNAKFRFPRVHRMVYMARFGQQVYQERFVNLSNSLRGDMAVGKDRHTNYRLAELLSLLAEEGFESLTVTRANLFWLWFQVPALLLGEQARRLLERLVYVDDVIFKSANFFLTAEKV